MNGLAEDEDGSRSWRNLSNAELVVIFLLGSPFYLFFTEFEDEPFKGFVAAVSAGVIATLIWMLRPLRHHPMFWACIAGLTTGHVALVAFLPYTGDFRFGFAFFPIAALDIYASARLIIFACGAKL